MPTILWRHIKSIRAACKNPVFYNTILYDVEDGILTLTLNRPEKLNAFTGEMLSEMIDAFDRADADDAVRAIIVTGAGRAFCAGADLSGGSDTFNSDRRVRPPFA